MITIAPPGRRALSVLPGQVRSARRVPATRLMGALVVASFCLVVAGPNLPTALLPAYRDAYRMTPFGLSLIFSAYLVLLVPALILCTRPALRARAGLLLSVGLALAVVADLVMVTSHSPQMLVVGRALSGVSVALSTGAAAALMVALVGERGRGSVATGNIAGALLGTVSAVLLAQVGAGPSVYLVHGAAVLVVLAMLLPALSARRAAHKLAPNTASIEPELADAPDPKTPAPTSSPAVIRRHAVLALAVGAVGWAIPGLVTGLVPALLRDFTGPTAVIVATSPAILLLGSAWGLQVLAKRPIMRRIRGYELTVGITMGAVGLTLLTVGALARSISLVYLGCAVAAGGPALGYRGGMVLLTRGLDPVAQGAATSRYAATSYGLSACVVLGAGAIGALGGMVTAVTVGAGLLALVAFALLATILTTESPRRTARALQAVRA